MSAANARGWTLLELMTVIGLLALVAALTGFGFGELLPGLHLRGAAQDLVLDLQYARWRALAQNQYYRVVFSPGVGSYALEREADNGGGRWPGQIEGTIREFNNPHNPYYHPGIEVQQVSRNPIFSPRGSVTGATVVLRCGGLSKVITISSLGRVKVE